MKTCCKDTLFNQLEIIDSVKFSAREIDIISCISNGRSPKFIANLLDISYKTVETHIRNIKIKQNCSSKEQIVSFVEKSDKHDLISQHYKNLVTNFYFERLLKNITQEVAKQNISIHFVCLLRNETETTLHCCKAVKHLSTAGFKTNLIYKNEKQINFSENNDNNNPQSDTTFLMLCSKEMATRILFGNSYEKPKKNVIWLINEALSTNMDINTEKDMDNVISYGSPNNYYYAILEIIQKLYNSKNIQNEINLFKSSYKINLSPGYTKEAKKDRKNTKKILSLYLIILILLVSAYYYLFEYISKSKQQISFNMEVLRSDIMLPRKKMMYDINDALKKQEDIIKYVILIGQGGMGKTTVARKYLTTQLTFSVRAEI